MFIVVGMYDFFKWRGIRQRDSELTVCRTTGQPKCIVHSVGGVVLGGGKEGRLHRDVDHTSTCLQYTTTGMFDLFRGCLSNIHMQSRLTAFCLRLDHVSCFCPNASLRRQAYYVRRLALPPTCRYLLTHRC